VKSSRGVLTVLVVLISGCAVRPVFGPIQMSLDVMGQRVVSYDQQNPLIGEIVYQGINRLKTEAKVFLDGKHITTMSANGAEIRMQPAEVYNFGWHVISGETFWVADNGVKTRTGCFRHEFPVSVFYNNAAYYWWKVEIKTNPNECF
jgi:hypothetical protein